MKLGCVPSMGVLRVVTFFGMLGAGIAMVACGSDAVETATSQPPEPRVAVDRALWQTAWELATDSNADPAQRTAMSDGDVSFEEYERAAFATVRCLTDAGMQGEAKLDPDSRTYELGARYQSLGSYEADEPRRVSAERCYQAHWYGVAEAWGAGRQPTQETLDDARAALGRCLREAGLQIPESSGEFDLQQFQSDPAWVPCVQRVGAEYNIPNYGGG